MTGLFFFLAMLALLVTSVCGIWLLVLSFREGALWGLAVLFIPFAVVVFAIRYWNQAKKPFLGHVGGSVAAAVFIVLFVMSGVSGQISEASDALDAAEAEPSFEATTPAPAPSTATAESAPEPRARSTSVAPRPRPVSTRAGLSFDNAEEFVGKLVRITAPDGRVLKGYLIDAKSDRLVFEKDLSSGVFTFEVTQNDVKSMEVIR